MLSHASRFRLMEIDDGGISCERFLIALYIVYGGSHRKQHQTTTLRRRRRSPEIAEVANIVGK